MLNVIKLPLGMFQGNCFVVTEGSDAFLVDPGDRPEEVLNYLSLNGLKLNFILLTHGHVDHVNGVDGIVKAHGVPVYLHDADRAMIEEGHQYFGTLGSETIPVTEGMIIPFAGHEISVIETPGHTEGGVSYLINGMLFAGDTLFHNTVGRTDLPGGDQAALLDSVRNKLFQLPDDTIVYSGHGDHTDIAHEKKYNYFVK